MKFPNIAETYVHRIGRTGRAGASGTAYSFCDAEEKSYLKDIEKLINRKIPVVEDHPLSFNHPGNGKFSTPNCKAWKRTCQVKSDEQE